MSETLGTDEAELAEDELSFPATASELLAADKTFTADLLQTIWQAAYQRERGKGLPHEVAQDLASVGILTVWAQRSKYREANSMGWAHTVARNAAIDALRHMTRPSYAVPGFKANTVGLAVDEISAVPSAEEEYLSISADETWDTRARAAFQAIGMSRAFDACMLILVQGYSYEDAAAELGVPSGTIKSWVNRVRAKFKAVHHSNPLAAFESEGR